MAQINLFHVLIIFPTIFLAAYWGSQGKLPQIFDWYLYALAFVVLAYHLMRMSQ